jgi:hypothetical protein
MGKFFVVMKSKHVTAADGMTQFYMQNLFEKQLPNLCESALEGELAPSYCAIRSSGYVEHTDRVWNVFRTLNIIRNRIEG